MEGIETNKKYTFAAYMDLDTGRLQIQADGKNVLLGEELYISNNLYTQDSENEFASANINRLFETRSDNGGEYTVDNIKITREAKLPVSNYSEAKTEWEDDFETFSTSNYAAAYVDNTKRDAISSSNNLIDFATLTNSEDTQKHGNILELKNARLLKQLSGTISGTYSVKADMYFTNTAANGLAFSINAKDSSVTAARLRVKDGYLKLQKGGNDIAGFKYETDTWYSVEVVFNTDTLDINAGFRDDMIPFGILLGNLSQIVEIQFSFFGFGTFVFFSALAFFVFFLFFSSLSIEAKIASFSSDKLSALGPFFPFR